MTQIQLRQAIIKAWESGGNKEEMDTALIDRITTNVWQLIVSKDNSFLNAVQRMRKLQKLFFSSERNSETRQTIMFQAKTAENEVDHYLIQKDQVTLFTNGGF